MDAYDSDSSAGEDSPYTETGVLLGYASKESTDDAISHLGGYPTWIEKTSSPSATFATCKVCNDHMTLLLQLNGDLPDRFPGHERWLYLFSCRRKTCRRKDGSIRGIRGNRTTKTKVTDSKPQPAERTETARPNIGAALFGATAASQTQLNPFSPNGSTTENSLNPFSAPGSNPFAAASSLAAKPAQRPNTTTLTETFASKARISDSPQTAALPRPHEPWPDTSSLPPPYPSYHFDAEYETLSAPSTPKDSHKVPMIESGESSGGAGEDKMLFESAMDKTFQKFADRMAQNPEQVLRYEFGGSPLLYSTADAVGKLLAPANSTSKVTTVANIDGSRIPRCGACGNSRLFELQLTPHAITVLEEDEMSIEGMDWGTVILAVCGKDCSPHETETGQVGYTEEWVGVQWEELEGSRK